MGLYYRLITNGVKVFKATDYNTLEVLLDCGLVSKYRLPPLIPRGNEEMYRSFGVDAQTGAMVADREGVATPYALFHLQERGVLFVPAGTPVSFRLTSATVWNVFFVPQMGTMIYTMPRMTTRLNLQADRQGTFNGLSAHFSGDGFPGMQFQVQSLPPDQFAMWAQGASGNGPVLDAAGYTQLEKPSSYVKPMTYGAVAPGLFDAIVANRAPPNPVPPPLHNRPVPGSRA